MDYEKKYKEALEKAKKLYGKYCINNVLEDLFPELKESEDENIIIRELLINEYNTWLDGFIKGLSFSKKKIIENYKKDKRL